MKRGWVTMKLSEVCDGKITDGTHQTPKYFDEGYIFLSSKNVTSGVIDWEKIKYLDEKQHLEMQKRLSPRMNDILLAKNGTTGVAAIVDKDVVFDIYVSLALLRPSENILPRLLWYFINSSIAKKQFNKRIKGVGVPNLHLEEIREVDITYPQRLSEQKRIVTILDEAFESIDAAIVNTKKNLASARELFDSYLNDIFTKKGKGWVEKTLNDSCIVERGSSPRPIKTYLTTEEDGVNWVKIGDTKGVTKYITSTKQKITPEGALRSRRVNPGDFILTNSMSYGKPYIMATSGYVHDGWFILRLKDELNTDFFYHLLTSKVIQEQFGSLAAGSVVKNISGDLVKKTILLIPPMEQQLDIVQAVELLSKESEHLEAVYQQKLDSLNELKQSLLAKAFSGELTAQPEPIQKEAVG